jgi:predicted protein tyrosine phosphatase
MRMNALWNCKNPHQGGSKKILCVCSAGLLRSPTVAWVLGNEGYNTRAVGLYDYALIQIDEVLIEWADHIVLMEESMRGSLLELFPDCQKPLTVLEIPDKFAFKEPALVRIVKEKLKDVVLV